MIEVTEKGRKITGWILIVVMILFAVVYHFVLQPKYRYKETANLIEQEKYEDAISMLELMKEDNEIISRKYECYYNIGLNAFDEGDFTKSVENLSKVPADYNAQGFLDAAKALEEFQGKWTGKENNIEIAGWDLKYYNLDGVATSSSTIDKTTLVVHNDEFNGATFMNEGNTSIYLIDVDGLLNVSTNDNLLKYLPGDFTKTKAE